MDSMDNRKEETIKMLGEIESTAFINMAFGFIRRLHREEKAVRRIEDIEERGVTHNG